MLAHRSPRAASADYMTHGFGAGCGMSLMCGTVVRRGMSLMCGTVVRRGMHDMLLMSSESCLVFLADAMTRGVWEELADLHDPELQRLAKSLKATMLHGRANSTITKYGYAFQRWKAWTQTRSEVRILPVGEVHFALYLQHFGESLESRSAVQDAVNAVSWVHQLLGFESITLSPLVQATVDGLKKTLAKPKVKKEPVTVEMLAALVNSLGLPPSLSDLRLAASCLLAVFFIIQNSLYSFAKAVLQKSLQQPLETGLQLVLTLTAVTCNCSKVRYLIFGSPTLKL